MEPTRAPSTVTARTCFAPNLGPRWTIKWAIEAEGPVVVVSHPENVKYASARMNTPQIGYLKFFMRPIVSVPDPGNKYESNPARVRVLRTESRDRPANHFRFDASHRIGLNSVCLHRGHLPALSNGTALVKCFTYWHALHLQRIERSSGEGPI